MSKDKKNQLYVGVGLVSTRKRNYVSSFGDYDHHFINPSKNYN